MSIPTKKQTLKEYGRGIIGGLLFSLPLVYTMEVWWSGFLAPAGYQLSCAIVTFLLLLGYNRYAGMKEDSSFLEICHESVEELALAVIVSFLFLLLLSRIDFQMSWDEIAGKVILESMIVAIGISVGTAQLGGNDENGSGSEEESESEEESGSEEGSREGSEAKSGNTESESAKEGKDSKDKDSTNLKRIILSLCGSVLFASSVAPTEEILMIGVGVNEKELLLMVFLSLILGGIIIYFSEFKGAPKEKPGLFKMLVDLIVMYNIALLVSFAFLWFFGRVQDYSLYIVVAQIIVLGIPASIGASAGRFLISK